MKARDYLWLCHRKSKIGTPEDPQKRLYVLQKLKKKQVSALQHFVNAMLQTISVHRNAPLSTVSNFLLSLTSLILNFGLGSHDCCIESHACCNNKFKTFSLINL